MKKIFIYTYTLLSFFSISTFAIETPFSGQTLTGTIGKYALGTEIILPEGEWIVAGVKENNGSIRWVELVLIQSESKKIKGIFNIKYPRRLELPIVEWDPSTIGWRKDKHIENNTCDDYDNQRSNFHEMDVSKKLNRIYGGSCISVYTSSVNNSIISKNDVWLMAQEFIKQSGIDYSEEFVFIDNTYFREKNVVHTYFAINHDFFKNEKSKFIKKAINIGKEVLRKNINKFSDNKKLDFTEYANFYLAEPISVKESKSTDKVSIISKLKELKEMFNNGLITQKQYEIKSDELLESY